MEGAVSFYLLTWCLHSAKRLGTQKVCQTLVTIGNTCSFPYQKLEQISAGPSTQATESRQSWFYGCKSFSLVHKIIVPGTT